MLLTSCKSSTYLLTNNNYRTGVDFTKGRQMVIKPIRLSWEQHRKLKAEAANFFDKLNDRYFYRENVGGLLILIKFFKPNKQSLKIKIGTGFDYLINISSEKKQDENRYNRFIRR
jgi:hypothetical protein